MNKINKLIFNKNLSNKQIDKIYKSFCYIVDSTEFSRNYILRNNTIDYMLFSEKSVTYLSKKYNLRYIKTYNNYYLFKPMYDCETNKTYE